MFKVKALKRLRYIGIIEGVSSLLLFFVAMPIKYVFGSPEYVSVVGMVHGVLFNSKFETHTTKPPIGDKFCSFLMTAYITATNAAP